MFGCLRRLGCLIILLAAAAAGYYWYTHRASNGSPSGATATWRPVTAEDAARGARAVATLQSSSGRVYANLTGTEAVGYLLKSVTHELSSSAQYAEAMISGDTLNVRTVIPLRELGAAQILGPMASFLGGQDTVQLGGTVDVIRPGLAQFRVTHVTIHGLTLPSPMVPKIIAKLRKNAPAGVAPNGFAIPLPPYISDIRIANGKITLYKNV